MSRTPGSRVVLWTFPAQLWPSFVSCLSLYHWSCVVWTRRQLMEAIWPQYHHNTSIRTHHITPPAQIQPVPSLQPLADKDISDICRWCILGAIQYWLYREEWRRGGNNWLFRYDEESARIYYCIPFIMLLEGAHHYLLCPHTCYNPQNMN